MQVITKYQADGTEFATAPECERHEILAADVRRQEHALLLVRPTNNEFLNGKGFVQQEAGKVLALQSFLIQKLVVWRRDLPIDVEPYLLAKTPVGMSHMGRLMDDCAPAPIRSAWHRVMCMDKRFREYGQPYFAIQANKRGS